MEWQGMEWEGREWEGREGDGREGDGREGKEKKGKERAFLVIDAIVGIMSSQFLGELSEFLVLKDF